MICLLSNPCPSTCGDLTAPFHRWENQRSWRARPWSKSVAELGWEARLLPLLWRTYMGTAGVTACLHNPVSSWDLETYQFCSIQDLTSTREEWKQLTLSSVAWAQAAWHLGLSHLPHACVSHRAKIRGHGPGGRWGLGMPRGPMAAIGSQSQPSSPFASLGGYEKKNLSGRSCRASWLQEPLQLHLGERFSCSYKIIASFLCNEDPADKEEQKVSFHQVYEIKRTFFLILGLYAAKVWLCFCKFAGGLIPV